MIRIREQGLAMLVYRVEQLDGAELEKFVGVIVPVGNPDGTPAGFAPQQVLGVDGKTGAPIVQREPIAPPQPTVLDAALLLAGERSIILAPASPPSLRSI
jgi:hypothetical protein